MIRSKYFIYLSAAGDRAQFQEAYLHAAREAATALRHLGRVVVNLVEDLPAATPFRPSNTDPELAKLAYDVIVELAPPDGSAEELLEIFGSCVGDIALKHIYKVEELVELDRQALIIGQRTPGVKYIGRLRWHHDLPPSAARRSWDIHVPLALKVHIGMDRYVRNWIVDDSRGPPAGGIAQLHFPTLEDMLERYFDSDRGKNEIMHDIKHFIASGTRFFTGEFVLRA